MCPQHILRSFNGKEKGTSYCAIEFSCERFSYFVDQLAYISTNLLESKKVYLTRRMGIT